MAPSHHTRDPWILPDQRIPSVQGLSVLRGYVARYAMSIIISHLRARRHTCFDSAVQSSPKRCRQDSKYA